MSAVNLVVTKRYGASLFIVEFPLYTAGTNVRKSGASISTGDFKIARFTSSAWSVNNPVNLPMPYEIGSTGMYYLLLSGADLVEDNSDHDIILTGHSSVAEWDDVCVIIQITRALDANYRANVGGWMDAAVNTLISGRVDANAQVVADKTGFTLENGEHIQFASDVWNVLAKNYGGDPLDLVTTMGNKLVAAGAAGDPWIVPLPGSYTTGQAGYILATAGTNAANIPAIKTQTDKLQFDSSNYVKAANMADSPGVTTLLSRLSSTRATYIDLLNTYLNYSVSTLATLVNQVKTNTDLLPADPASETSVEAAITTTQTAILADTLIIKNKTNNLPASPAAVGSQMDLVNAPNATAVTAIQSGLALASSITTVLNRLGAWTGSGRNTILGALQALFRKDADATPPTDINTNLGSGAGTYDNTTDSNEAIRDNMSSSSAPSAATVATAVWAALRSANIASGSFGEGVASVQGNVTGTVASVAGNVSGNLNGNVQGNVVGSVASVVGNVGGMVSDSSGVTTLLTRLTSNRAIYLDALAGWSSTVLNAFKALARKDATASADIGGTHNPATDSEEALAETLSTFNPGASIVENITIDELST